MPAFDSIHRVKEGASARFRTLLKDDTGTAFEPADVDSIKATLVSLDDRTSGTPQTINSRSAVEIKGANGGTFVSPATVSNVYNLQWLMDPADNPILDESRSQERHLLVLTIKYGGNTRTGITEHLIVVENTETV